MTKQEVQQQPKDEKKLEKQRKELIKKKAT